MFYTWNFHSFIKTFLNMKNGIKKVFETFLALVALGGIMLTLIGSGKTGNFCEAAAEVFRLLFFFTIDSSLFVLILFTIKLLSGKKAGWISENPVLTGAVTINILVTGIVFILMLRSFESTFGPVLYAGNIMLHYILPLLCLTYFMIYTKDEKILYRDIFYWTIFPVVYFLVTILRGAYTGMYPYPFIDARVLGYSKVFLNSLFILTFIIILSFVLVSVKKLKSKLNIRMKTK
jgi:hypothetical protein